MKLVHEIIEPRISLAIFTAPTTQSQPIEIGSGRIFDIQAYSASPLLNKV